MATHRETQYYVGRVHLDNGHKEFIQEDGRGLFRPTPNESSATRYEDNRDTATIANHLNRICEQLENGYEYFVVQSIDDRRVFVNNLSDEAKKWFDTDEETDEEDEE